MTQLITSLGIVGEEFFVCKENHQKGCVGERESYSGTTTREGGKRSAINIRSKSFVFDFELLKFLTLL